MKFSLMWPLRNPEPFRRPLPELYRDTLDEIVAAEELGFHGAYLTEHHFAEDDYLPSVFPMMAAMAERTSRIRIGPYVMLMPFHHPVRLAEDAAVTDVISDGRVDLHIGVAYREEEFNGFGLDKRTRGRRHEEGTSILLQAWSDEPVNHQGKIFQIEDLNVTPKPVQRPIPLYLGGTSRPVLERIARHPGVRGVSGRPNPEDMDFFHEKLAENGRDPDEIEYVPFRFLWVDRDHERAAKIATPWVEWILGRYQKWFAKSGNPMFEGDITRYCIMGNPEYCIERLETFLGKGPDVASLVIQPPLLGLDHSESMRMIETFATEVAPHFEGR